MSRNDLPSEKASNFSARLRETIQTMLGTRGDKLDRVITLRDLIESGITELPAGWRPGGSGAVPLLPGPNLPDPEEYVPDLTPPPQPDGFVVDAAISHIFIEHAAPTYTQGHGHMRTVVYGAQVSTELPNPVFNDAIEIAQFTGTVFAYPTNPATTWRLWIKWQTNDGVLSATPAGGTNGLEATTGQNVGSLLAALAGQITSSELSTSLSAPIALINQPTTGILARLDANRASIDAVQAEVAALSGTPDYDASTTYVLDNMVKYSGGLYRALGETTGNLPTNGTYWQKIGDYASLGDAVAAHAVTLDEHTTRITANESGLVSEANSRNTLATQLRGTYTGTDVAALSSGLVHSERQARVTAVAAEATSRNTLQTKLIGAANPATATLAGLSAGLIFDERQARSTAVSSAVARIDGLEATVNNGTTGVLATANALDAVELLVNNSETGVTATATKTSLLQSKLGNIGAVFTENWEGALASAEWQEYGGAGEFEVVNILDSPAGGRVLRVGNNAGNDQAWRIHKGLIPFDPSKTYRMRVPVRRLQGAGTVYLGWAGVAADGVTLVNISGGNGSSNQHYHTATGSSPASTWTTYTGFTKGHASTTGESGVGTAEAPKKMHPLVRYLRPLVLVNYSNMAGVTEVGQILVEDISETNALSASLQVESTTRATQTGELYAQYTVKTDVGGMISGYGLASTANNAAPTSAFGIQAGQFFVAPPTINQSTAPASPYKGMVWRNSTTGLVQYYTGSAWSTTPQSLPFVVQTTATTINGVSVPAGVYMQDAFIQNGTITNAKIGNAAIDSLKVADAAISTAKIADAAITTAKIGSAQITTALIADAAITNALIANAAITTAKIGSAQITSALIADANITNAKIADAAITNAKIGSAAVNTANIGDAQITNAKIANLAVTGAKIANATITSAQIANATITSAQIANATITSAKIGTAEVNTLNIAGNAVSSTGLATGSGSCSTSLNIPAGVTAAVTCVGWMRQVSGSTSSTLRLDMSVSSIGTINRVQSGYATDNGEFITGRLFQDADIRIIGNVAGPTTVSATINQVRHSLNASDVALELKAIWK
jgi:uncharacterized protein YjbI with pentapeptide repeats